MRADYRELDPSKKILVTGAAGFIGYHLCARLLGRGCAVAGLDNMNDYYDVRLKEERLSRLRGMGRFSFYREDLADGDGLGRAFAEASPEIVVNLAAQAGVRYSIENPGAYVSSNLVGFFNVLECCRRHPVEHLVYASSSSVYGMSGKVPYSTSDPVDNPVSFYAATKKSNELMAYSYGKLYGIASTGLRFFTVYGPMGRPDMAYFKFAKSIMDGEPIRVYNHGDMLRDFTYIDDIVEGVERILDNPPLPDGDGVRYKIYNIGNNRPVRLTDFIQVLEDSLGKKARKEFLPMQPGDVYQTCADIEELERDFGFRPKTTIEEGMGRFAEWFLVWREK